MSRLRISRNARWYLPAAGLALVLVLLGLLQYRANRQLRDVLQQQMLTEAQTALMRIRRGMEEELRPICNISEPASGKSSENGLQSYAAQLSRMRVSSGHPGLVAQMFIYQPSSVSYSGLLEFSAASDRFIAAEWPSGFNDLREYLQRLAPAVSSSLNSSSADVPGPTATNESGAANRMNPAGFPWFIDENIPALVHPIRGAEASISFLIVKLGTDELAQKLLPQLAEREFGSNRQLNYRVALVNFDKQRTILYSSDPEFGAGSDVAPDVQLNVFGPPGAFPGSGGENGSPGTVATAVRAVQNQSMESSSGAEAHGQNPPLRIQPIHYRPNDRGWMLIARHRKGSVEAAVVALYRRNLTVDFGVLLVLAAMIATMVISVRRAHQLAQMRMDFVASVSHELRTPLTGILSSAQNIADGLVTNNERAVQYGAAILSQAHQLAELVEEILLFSSTERGRIYNFQWLDVSQVISAALEGASSQLRAAQVRVEQKAEANLPQVWGDFKALTQGLQNLIVNAIKYGGDQHWIGIFASVAPMPNSTCEVVVTVEDKGLGIGTEDLQRIFDPFYRSPAVTGEQIHGSGLGLSIVKSIAEAMGGKLTVQSELGKGSSFSLHLPAEKKSSPAEAPTQSSPAEAAGIR